MIYFSQRWGYGYIPIKKPWKNVHNEGVKPSNLDLAFRCIIIVRREDEAIIKMDTMIWLYHFLKYIIKKHGEIDKGV